MGKEKLVVLLLLLWQALPGAAQQAYGGAESAAGGFEAGKYVLTNVATGKTSYLFVSAGGDVYLQGGPAVQPSVQPQVPQSKYGVVPGLLGGQQSGYRSYGTPGYAQPQGYRQMSSGYGQAVAGAYGQQPAYAQAPQGYPQPQAYGQQGSVSPVFGLPPRRPLMDASVRLTFVKFAFG